MEKKPQVWAWLGDIVYTDRMIMPLVWVCKYQVVIKSSIPSSKSFKQSHLGTLQEPNELSAVKSIWDQQKAHPKYQQFLHSGVSVVGVWDDHDYGHNNAGGEFTQKELVC